MIRRVSNTVQMKVWDFEEQKKSGNAKGDLRS